VNTSALDSLSASVNQTHLAKALLEGCVEIGIHHLQNLPRLEVVEVDSLFDGEHHRLIVRLPRLLRVTSRHPAMIRST